MHNTIYFIVQSEEEEEKKNRILKPCIRLSINKVRMKCSLHALVDFQSIANTNMQNTSPSLPRAHTHTFFNCVRFRFSTTIFYCATKLPLLFIEYWILKHSLPHSLVANEESLLVLSFFSARFEYHSHFFGYFHY